MDQAREKQAGMKNGVSWGVVAVTRRSSSHGELRGGKTLKREADNKEGQCLQTRTGVQCGWRGDNIEDA